MENYTVLTYIIGDYKTVHELEFDPANTPHVEYLLITDNKNIIFSKYQNFKWIFIRDSIFGKDVFFNWYTHGENNKLYINPNTFIPAYFNDKPVDILF